MMKKYLLLFLLVLVSLPNVQSATLTGIEVGELKYDLDTEKMTASVARGDYRNLTSVVIPSSIIYGNKVYFVTSIGDEAFYGRGGLTSVEIPNSVTSIGGWAFYGCGLTGLNFPPGLTSIGGWAFSYCHNLEIIIFNSERMLTLGTQAFEYCDSLSEIYCNTTRPPVSNDFSVFENSVYSTANLYVPEKDLSLYYSVTPWSKFFNIIGTDTFPDPSGVENITLENQDTEDAPYYNLTGQIVKNPTPGIYIRNGKKVIVK